MTAVTSVTRANATASAVKIKSKWMVMLVFLNHIILMKMEERLYI